MNIVHRRLVHHVPNLLLLTFGFMIVFNSLSLLQPFEQRLLISQPLKPKYFSVQFPRIRRMHEDE